MEKLGFALHRSTAEVIEKEVYELKGKIMLILVAASLIFVTGSVMALKGGADPQNPGEIYVAGQELYYHTFVAQDPLPYNGHNGNSFQRLYFVEGQATTDFGPGNPGYKGGRWWVDLNNDNVMDPEGTDHYNLCPLIGPGYE